MQRQLTARCIVHARGRFALGRVPLEGGRADHRLLEVDGIVHLRDDEKPVAVPNEVVNKYARIAELAKLQLDALEVETFSLARALVGSFTFTRLMIGFSRSNQSAGSRVRQMSFNRSWMWPWV